VTSATAATAPASYLIALKDRAARQDRPRDKAVGRWLGDFLNQPTPSGLLPVEDVLLQACAEGQACNALPAALAPAARLARFRAFKSAARVRAGFLRFLALGGDDSAPVHEAGVDLTNAYIDDKIDLRGAKCIGRLALTKCYVDGALEIEDASLGILYLVGSRVKGIVGDRAKIAGSVFLRDGFVSNGTVKLFSAKIDGSVQCAGGKIRGGAQQQALVCTAANIGGNVLLNERFSSTGSIWLNGADIRGDLRCETGSFTNRHGPALNCDGARISGSLRVTDATTIGAVSLINARVGADLDGARCSLTNAAGNALVGDAATISGGVNLGRATSTGLVSFAKARIGADLDCRGAALTGSDDGKGGHGTALDSSAAIIGGSVLLDEIPPVGDAPAKRFVATGGAVFNATEIGQDLSCRGSWFSNVGRTALDLLSARIKGSAYIVQLIDSDTPGQRFEADGLVTLYGATVGGELYCCGGRFTNPAGSALLLDATRITGGVQLNQIKWYRTDNGRLAAAASFEARGTVSLYGADIGGHLDCEGGRFWAPEPDAATPTSAAGPAIAGDILSVAGCVFLSGPETARRKTCPELRNFRSHGEVRLLAARVGMQLNCLGGEFVNEAPDDQRNGVAACALNLEIARVGYETFFGTTERTDRPPATIRGSINLRGTTTRELVDRGFIDEAGVAEEYFPATVGPQIKPLVCDVVMDGFSYERLNGDACLSAEARLGWLLRQPRDDLAGDFRHQPFDHLVSVLRAMGHDDDARDLSIAKQDQLTGRIDAQHKHLAGAGVLVALALLAAGQSLWAAIVIGFLLVTKSGQWLWRTVFRLSVGYGYRPGQGLVIALAIAMAAGWFYQQAQANGGLGRHSADSGSGAPAVAPFHPYVYSFDVMLPVVKLGQAEAWQPTNQAFTLRLPMGFATVPVAASATQFVVWTEMVFGWLAGGILVALVSGLIKKD
jgi:hypothetical protein